VRAEETVVLARYHRALELSGRPDVAPPEPEADDLSLWRNAPASERAALLRMLVEVAAADYRLHRREKRLLARFAETLGVSSFEFEEIWAAAEHELERHARAGYVGVRRAAAAGALGLFAALLLVWAFGLWPRGEMYAAEAVFREVEQKARQSLLLIEVEYVLSKPGEPDVRRRSSGTGFFLTADGVIATNKHVLQPWRFPGDVERRLADGWSFVEGSDQLFVYPAGRRVFNDDGRRVLAGAFDEARGTVAVVATADDAFEDGLHALDSSDLALLRVFASGPVPPLPLAEEERPVETLDPVLVLGFPDGRSQFEGGRAIPTVARGEVGKVEDMFVIQAQLLPGSSGGPVLDAEGRVIGIASRVVGGSAYGRCIRAAHLSALCRAAGVALER
jgi:hypothetical protein